MSEPLPIVLASASPRRHELLRQLDVTFSVAPADVDETITSGEAPDDYVLRLARAKALAGFARAGEHAPSLGADTIVVLNGEILGKPVSRKDARDMLQRLSGQTHQVYSAVALATGGSRVSDRLNVTAVTFAELPPSWIRRYCDGGEPMDKAGAYAIQGQAGRFIKCIKGSYSGVMGLPLHETAELLAEAGLLV